MCIRTQWEYSSLQLIRVCLMLNAVLMYFYVNNLVGHVYVIIKLGTSYEFGTLYVLLGWMEGVCIFVLIIDLIWVCCRMANLMLTSIIVAFLMSFFMLLAGSVCIVKYTDVYVVTRSFYSENMWVYETSFQCCGIDGPQNYADSNNSDNIPLSCYRKHQQAPENLYKRGCLFATTDNWFWFIFGNSYWLSFALFVVDLITHWKLRMRFARGDV